MGVGILPQDVLGGLDCSFNFAIGLWVEQRGGDVCEPHVLGEVSKFLADVLGSIVRDNCVRYSVQSENFTHVACDRC